MYCKNALPRLPPLLWTSRRSTGCGMQQAWYLLQWVVVYEEKWGQGRHWTFIIMDNLLLFGMGRGVFNMSHWDEEFRDYDTDEGVL